MLRGTTPLIATTMLAFVFAGCGQQPPDAAGGPGRNDADAFPVAEPVPKLETVDAEELCRSYADNPAEADKRFLDQPFIVSGKVVDRTSSFNTHIIYLETTHDISSLRCEFPQSAYNDLVTLHAGKHVWIRGLGAGLDGSTIKLVDCALD